MTADQRNRANTRRRALAASRRAQGIPLRTPEQKARKRERERQANKLRKEAGLKSQRTERRQKAVTRQKHTLIEQAAINYQEGGSDAVDPTVRLLAATDKSYWYHFKKGTGRNTK